MAFKKYFQINLVRITFRITFVLQKQNNMKNNFNSAGTNLANAQKARNEAALKKQIRYNGNVITLAQFVELLKQQGATSEIKQVPAVQLDRVKLNRLTNDQQEAHNKRVLHTKPEYRLLLANSIFTVSKAEYDYFNTLK